MQRREFLGAAGGSAVAVGLAGCNVDLSTDPATAVAGTNVAAPTLVGKTPG